MDELPIIRGATLSPCRKYRYRLFRQWAPAPQPMTPPLLWIMLNPSTADECVDDATIRRCMAFSRSWGYVSMWVANLYAYRATDPAVIKALPDDVARGPDNAWYIADLMGLCDRIICAWGSTLQHLPETMGQVATTRRLECLGVTKNGQPRHPLRLSAKTPLQEYRP